MEYPRVHMTRRKQAVQAAGYVNRATMPPSSLMGWLESTGPKVEVPPRPKVHFPSSSAIASNSNGSNGPSQFLPSPPPSSPLLPPKEPLTAEHLPTSLKRKRDTQSEDNDPTKSPSNTQNSSAQSTESLLELLSTRLLEQPQYQQPLPTPYPDVTIHHILPEHITPLKHLTATLLPIRYPDKFFDEILTSPTTSTISRVAVYAPPSPSDDDRPSIIGAIRCQLHPLPPTPTSLLKASRKRNNNIPPPLSHPSRIYIATLLLLAPYRSLGIATALVDAICAPEIVEAYNVERVYAHVWERNEEALGWYERRGFVKGLGENEKWEDGDREGFVEGYYRKLRPGGAWIVSKEMKRSAAAVPDREEEIRVFISSVDGQ